MPNLRKTKEILNEYKVLPKKSLGQNFLVSEKIIQKIIVANNLSKLDHVLEIGPGIGALTEPLLQKVKQVDAYEIDQNMISILKNTLKEYDNLNLYHEDILKVDLLSQYQTYTQIKIIANLPYYITTKIIEKIICELPNCDSLCLMMQKEAAERIQLTENQSKYGITAILVKLFGGITQKIDVNASNFYPRPKVNSQVLFITQSKDSVFNKQLQINPEFNILDFKLFLEKSFSMRRKTLINNWRKVDSPDIISNLENELEKLELNSFIRPEQISPEKFWQLYLNMANYRS